MTSEEMRFHVTPGDIVMDLPGDSMEEKRNSSTHTFSSFPGSEDDEDETQFEKNDLLRETKKQPSFWTIEYYQDFFDVDTNQVLGRIFGSMIPNPRRNFLQSHIRPKPDLYGPFWVCATLIFTTAIAGNLSNYIQSVDEDYQWVYDFHKVTFAATAIFGYWWLLPTILWGVLYWRGNKTGVTFTEIICVYGYSLSIYVPISILWLIPVSWVQWLLVMLGMFLSGSVLVLTFWPTLREDTFRISVTTTALMMIFHGLLAVGFVLYFFKVSSSTHDVAPTANITTPTLITVATTVSHRI